MFHHHRHRRHFSYEQRVYRGNSVSIPHTTDATVIFRYNQCAKIFERELYHPTQTDNRASQEHINQVLSEVEAVIRNKLGCLIHQSYFILLAMLILFIGLVIFISSKPQGPGFAFGGFFGLFCFIMLLDHFTKKRKEEARIVAYQVLDQHNERLKDMGLRWSLPVHFPMWIELNNDFRIQAQTGVIIVQQPMPVVMTQPAQTFPVMNQQTAFMNPQPQFQQGYYPQQGGNMYYAPPPQQNMHF